MSANFQTTNSTARGNIFSRTSTIFHSRVKQPALTALSQPFYSQTHLPSSATSAESPVFSPYSPAIYRQSQSRPASRDGNTSRTHRRVISRHSLSSLSEISSNLRHSVSPRSTTDKFPITTPTDTAPTTASFSPPSGLKPSFINPFASLGRRSRRNISGRSPTFPLQSPTTLQSPAGQVGEDETKMAALSITAVSSREPLFPTVKRPTGTSQSNAGFGEGGKSALSGASGVPALPPGAAQAAYGQHPNFMFTHIQETCAKRINTLLYLRKAHEGRVYWFNTLLFTTADLRRLPYFEARRLARRATNYLLLGFSLPQILDLSSQTPAEYLRALNSLLAEYETYQSLHPPDGSSSNSLTRARIPNMFKRATAVAGGSKTRRQSSATDVGLGIGGGGPGGDVSEPTTVTSPLPPISFPPPGSMMGGGAATTMPPSDPAFSAAGWDHAATAGGGGGGGSSSSRDHESYALLVTPNLPFEPDFAETFTTLCDVLVDVYRGIVEMVGVPEKVGPGVGEAFAKADGRVRKLLVLSMVKEFEDAGRAGVKQEVGGLGKIVLGGLM